MSRRPEHAAVLVAIPVLVLTSLLGGAAVLERIAPRVDPAGLAIEDLEPLALEGRVERCVRREEGEVRAAEVRAQLPAGGRVSSGQVIACPQAFDQLTVAFVGEAIGHLLERPDGAWVQLNDDAYALELGPLPGHDVDAGANGGLAVWLPTELASQVDQLGGPGRRGDVVRVEGVLHRSDPADGGGLTLRASQLEVVAESVELRRPLHVPQAIAAAVAVACAAAAALALRRARRA